MSKKYHVIFHLDEAEKAQLVLNNIENLLKDLGPENVDVELLANAEGVLVLTKEFGKFEEKLTTLSTQSVLINACANTMKQKNLTQEDLLNFVGIVPSGVGELVRKQAEGWAYIKP